MDPGSSSRPRPVSDALPSELVETLDSSSEDNVPLIKRISQNHLGGAPATRSSGHGGDVEAGLDSDDSFFNDLEEF